MSVKQIVSLFLVSLILYTTANGLLPLLPVYANLLGAAPSLIGYTLSFAYFALAMGTLLASWLSDSLQQRKIVLILAGALTIPGVWLMGRATAFWHMAVLTAIAWFLIGIGLTMTSILTGLFAPPEQRGKIFGIIGLTIGLGSILGGATIGNIADQWGYSTMFGLLALFLVLWPLTGLFTQDKTVAREQSDPSEATGISPTEQNQETSAPAAGFLAGPFLLLLLSNLLAMAAYFGGNMGRSLVMKDLAFSSAAISSTAVASGLVTLPLPPLIGWLSDRIGRKTLIALCYLAGAGGTAVLVLATTLWQYWVALSLLTGLVISYSIGSALATDLVPQQSLGVGLSLFSATTWAGGIIGFASTGFSFETLGVATTLIVAACLPVLGIVLVLLIRQKARAQAT